MTAKDAIGTVYLIHISPDLHYTGWTEDLETRLAQHRATGWVEYPEPVTLADGRKCKGHKTGDGATLLGVANARGLDWSVSRIWEGSRAVERRIKNWKGSRPLCPICSGMAAYNRGNFDTPEHDPAQYQTAGGR